MKNYRALSPSCSRVPMKEQKDLYFHRHCTCSWWLSGGSGAGLWRRKRRVAKLMREPTLYA
jgi:hypothetical protein